MSDNDSIKPSGESEDEKEIKDIVKELENAENEDNPEWDGTQGELVSDDDAEEYEIPETGYKISYVLTQEEMYKCLYHSNMFKTKGTRAVIQSVILGIAAVIFFVIYFTTNSQYNKYNIVFGIICLLTIAAIWIVPHLYLSTSVKLDAPFSVISAYIDMCRIDFCLNCLSVSHYS